VGGGQDDYADLEYAKAGLDVFADYTRSSPRFLPRLGFFPEHDYQGPTGGVFYSHPFPKGRLLEYDLGVFGVDYRRTTAPLTASDRDVNATLKFREGTALYLDVDGARFEGVGRPSDHPAAGPPERRSVPPANDRVTPGAGWPGWATAA